MYEQEYQDFKKLINNYQSEPHKPRLLLHSCCGPCSSYTLELLNQAFDITIYYYNPNIFPMSEYNKRLDEQYKVVKIVNPQIKVISVVDDYQIYEQAIQGYENLPEGSMRCYKCYQLRIEKLAQYAIEQGFDFFTTTLSISPYKNSQWINEIGQKYETKQCRFLYSNFKKENGYQKSIAFSKKHQIYRQDYCGCAYSIQEHQQRLEKAKR